MSGARPEQVLKTLASPMHASATAERHSTLVAAIAGWHHDLRPGGAGEAARRGWPKG